MIRRSKAQWLALFEAHDKSGLTATAFCREHQLNPTYFSQRRKQLVDETLSSSHKAVGASRFVSAIVDASPRRDVVVSVGAVSVAIPLMADPQWAAHLIKHLQG